MWPKYYGFLTTGLLHHLFVEKRRILFKKKHVKGLKFVFIGTTALAL